MSDVRLSDSAIDGLVDEPKPELDPGSLVPTTPKRGHLESSQQVEGEGGAKFRVFVRQRATDPLDFSVIFGFQLPDSNRVFRLRRFNGLSHQHTNPIERETFFDYHVHVATERYQALAAHDEEHYARPTDAYVDLAGALQHMLDTCGFEPPVQMRIGGT